MQQAADRATNVRDRLALGPFDGLQLRPGVISHFLFEPLRDLGRLKLPLALHVAAGNASAMHELLDLATIASEKLRQLVQCQALVHAAGLASTSTRTSPSKCGSTLPTARLRSRQAHDANKQSSEIHRRRQLLE